MKKKININYYHILLITSIISLIPVVILCFYDRQSADDYSYAILTHESVVKNLGLINLLKSSLNYAITEYKRWVGCFICTMIGSLHPGIFGGKYYMFAPMIILLWMYICIRYLIGSINKIYIRKGKIISITLSLWIMSFFLMWIPSITESIYWFCAASVYSVSFFAILMDIGLLLRINNEANKRHRFLLIFASCLLSFLAADGHIMVSFVSVVFIFIITALYAFHKKFYNLIPFSVCFIRFLFNYFSPGIAARSEIIASSPLNFVDTIKQSIIYSKNFLFSNTTFILIIFLFSLTPFIISIINNNKVEKVSTTKLFLLILGSYLLLTAISCVPVCTSIFPYRAINIIWMSFVIIMIIDYYFLIEYLYINHILNLSRIKNNSLTILMVVFCIVVIFGTNTSKYRNRSLFVRAKNEIVSETAKAYANELDEREQLLLKSKGEDIRVNPLYTISDILYFDDITNDRNDWRNLDVATYFELKSIYAEYE